jgi:hypothetical protein
MLTEFAQTICRVQGRRVAHFDLKNPNVMVDALSGKLVDDAAWPSLANTDFNELSQKSSPTTGYETRVIVAVSLSSLVCR